MKNLQDHTAIISGGLGDIGRAIAWELAGQGANIAIGDILPPPQSKTFLRELRAQGVKARYDCVDVSDAAAVESWVSRVEKTLGLPNLIIPNAAIVTFGSVLTVTPEIWTRELQVNLTGAFYLAQAGARRLVAKASAGRIVFVGSWAAHAPHPTIIAYGASKAGLRMVMKCMALELAEKRILVNEVAPGYVDAGLSGRCFERDPASRVKAREQVPIEVLISSEDVALQVAQLCQPAIRQMTGSVILMDGGLSLSTPAFAHQRAESSSKLNLIRNT